MLDRLRPDWVLVYGDTNSTLAGALSAVKLHLRVAHLEAGLRSFNRRMPEEHNRVLTDHAADLLLAPTEEAVRHLKREGLDSRTVLVGDVMVDVCLRIRDEVSAGRHQRPNLPDGVNPELPYLVATLHRPDNTDDPVRLAGLIEALARLPIQVALLAHPRLVAKASAHGISLAAGSVYPGRPLPYAGLVAAVLGSAGAVTDSGGLQKEAFLLGRACTTIRPETEWIETLQGGWNILMPDPALSDKTAWVPTATRSAPSTDIGAPYGTGRAAIKVLRALEDHLPLTGTANGDCT